MPSVDAVWPKIQDWVEARKKDGQSATDVIDALGLHLLHAAGTDEKQRWVIAAMAVAQYKQLSQPRTRLPDVDSPSKVVDLLQRSKRILVISGPGASSKVAGFEAFFEGAVDGYTADYDRKLTEAAALFDAGHFVRNPLPLLSYVRYILGQQLKAEAITPSHKLIRELEKRGALLRNYSQNIDGLERVAGIERVVACHGSVSGATCLSCKTKVPMASCMEDLKGGKVPTGPCENEVSVLKPDVAFLNESGASQVDLAATEAALRNDLAEADLLVLLGASAEVEPLRSAITYLHRSVPQVYISPDKPPFKHAWDVELRGDCDHIASHLCGKLGWTLDGVDGAAAVGEEPLPDGERTYRFGTASSSSSSSGGFAEQTPLAMVSMLLSDKRAAKRGSMVGLTGATLAGSGVGARVALATTAPIMPPPPAANVFDPAPAADRSETNAARKRPMPDEEGANGEEEVSNKKAAA